jgi:predicted metal-dependent enzyme (double-stranded beta helix superfamily)
MFDVDELLAELQVAGRETEPRLAVRDVLDRNLERAREMADALAPTEGGLSVLHQAPDLTVLHVVWAPGMVLYPHDHQMWAVIGIYAGQEDNTFYRRDGKGLIESGGKRLETKDVAVLGDDTIHQVANPWPKLTGAIHVYGGDFVNEPRSQWGPGERIERPYDFDQARQQFVEANAAWRAAGEQR